MAHTQVPVEVLTPEGEVFNGEVEMLSTRTTVGEVGVLANHAPLLATLDPAELRLHLSETEIEALRPGRGLPPGVRQPGARAGRGVHRARPDRPRCAAGEAAQGRGGARAIDQEALCKRVREARTTAERDEARQLTAEYDNALADKKRAETFLRLAGEQL